MTSEHLEIINRQFPPAKIHEIIETMLKRHLAFTEKKLQQVFHAYDEATRKGVPFAERQKLIDQDAARFLETERARLTHDLKGFRVIPFSQWLEDGDYEMMKNIGFRLFLEITIHRAYVATTDPGN